MGCIVLRTTCRRISAPCAYFLAYGEGTGADIADFLLLLKFPFPLSLFALVLGSICVEPALPRCNSVPTSVWCFGLFYLLPCACLLLMFRFFFHFLASTIVWFVLVSHSRPLACLNALRTGTDCCIVFCFQDHFTVFFFFSLHEVWV